MDAGLEPAGEYIDTGMEMVVRCYGPGLQIKRQTNR